MTGIIVPCFPKKLGLGIINLFVWLIICRKNLNLDNFMQSIYVKVYILLTLLNVVLRKYSSMTLTFILLSVKFIASVKGHKSQFIPCFATKFAVHILWKTLMVKPK